MDIIISILAGLTGLSASLIAAIFQRALKKEVHKDKNKDIAIKIQAISKSLSNSSNELIDIENQLKERISFVENLNTQAQKAEHIASLNQEQVNAINDLLGDNLKKESRKSFWQGVIVNFIFFVLGATVSFIISRYFL